MENFESYLEEIKEKNWQIMKPLLSNSWQCRDQLMKVIEEVIELWKAAKEFLIGKYHDIEVLVLLIDCFDDEKDKHAFMGVYEQNFLGTIESELADCFISLMTFCSITGRDIIINRDFNIPVDNILLDSTILADIVHKLSNPTTLCTDEIFRLFMLIAEKNAIDIKRHIAWKMYYNKIRGSK